MLVQDIMSRQLISAHEQDCAAFAARLLSRYNIGMLPVCSKDGTLRGIVTDRDLALRCLANEEDPTQLRLADIMTRRVITAAPEQSVAAAAQLMAREQIRRLPVTQGRRVVGILSLSDLARTPDFSTEAAAALSEISENVKFL